MRQYAVLWDSRWDEWSVIYRDLNGSDHWSVHLHSLRESTARELAELYCQREAAS